ncbi:MAG TPA: hypothetical protein VFC19_03005 [Candidatus Limnocylindrales bacterium]|nr:hypothetical protein [Candidatus Limnocylindrales bacterium]
MTEAGAVGEVDAAEGERAAVDVHADAFAKFSPAGEEVLRRWARTRGAIARFFIHEWTLAALASVALAVIMTWPTLRYPAYTIPQDVWDPTLEAWMMGWSGHAVLTDVSQLWNANSFYPEQLSYAFTDTLLGYFPAGMIGSGFTAALIRYNIMYVLLHALAFFGAYVLVRQLGSGKTGAAIAGAAFAYAPWRLAQAGHMHVLSTGGIALALAMLARGHGFSLRNGYQPEKRKPIWALAGWLVAAWQISLGFGIGLPFAYVMAAIAVITAIWLLVKRFVSGPFPFGGRLFTANLFGGLVFVAVGVLMALPYLRVAELHPYAVRSEAEVGLYSPPLFGFFVSPAESAIWGSSHAAARESLPWHPEMTLLPGFVLYGLAAAGLIMSIWTIRQRILLAAGVVLSTFLAMGTAAFDGGRPGYMTLYDILPGWDALRTSGRLIIWTTLLLGILAAGAVSAFVEQATQVSVNRVPARPHPLLRMLTLIPVTLVLLEGLNNTPHPVVPTPPPSLAQVKGPMLVLPSDSLRDEHVMLWLTDRFEPIVNGGSGFEPNRTREVREAAKSFPDVNSVTLLRELGVTTVVVLKENVRGTPYEGALTASVDGLNVKREEKADAVIFTLGGESGSPPP